MEIQELKLRTEPGLLIQDSRNLHHLQRKIDFDPMLTCDV
jgi:hypothetical protein